MTRFPTPGHLASWAGRTPLDRQSGQRAGKARRKHGNQYIGAVTGETSAAAGKTDTREGAAIAASRAAAARSKANVALGNTQMRVYHVLLSSPGMRYADLVQHRINP
jgi:transposase